MKNPFKGMKIEDKTNMQMKNLLPETIAPTVLPENQYKWILTRAAAYPDKATAFITYELKDNHNTVNIYELRITVYIPPDQTPLQFMEGLLARGFPYNTLLVKETQMAVGLPFDYENKQ